MPGKGSSHSVDADIQNIRQILENYDYGFPILKELIQNADDAKAQELNIGLLSGFPDSSHPLLRGPLLFAVNDGPFTKSNSSSIKNLGLSDKPSDFSAVGRFGIGLKSLFHLCESFFFMGADDSGSLSGCDIYNPWSPQQESNEVQLHGDWDDAAIGYDQLIAFLSQLLPDGPWSRSDSGWFCIWVPLRQKVHCSGIDSLVDNFPGDQENPLEGILPENDGTEFSSILPLLSTLKSIRLWTPKLDGSQKLLSQFVLSDDSSRGSWNRSEDQILEEPNRFKGRILEAGLTESESVFAGIEVCPEHLALSEYKRDEAWPKRRGLSNTGTGVDIKEKAAPHAMVCFARHPDSPGKGSLSTMWSVFLPLGAPDVSECEIPLKISLTLHGYFFVDNGRTGIDFPLNHNLPTTIRHKWNNDLLGEVLLPQILPALKSFTEVAALSDEEISALTSSLSGSIVGSNQYRSRICTNVNWVYRILNGHSSWSLIEREHPILRVPEGPPELICSVLPALTAESSDEYAVVPGARPSFTNQSGGRWPINLLQASLNPPLSIFEKSEQLEYFCEFVGSHRSEIEGSINCHDQLVDLVREVIGSCQLDQLLNRKDEMRKIISLIPDHRIFPIPNDSSPVRNVVVKRIVGLETNTLFVPEELVPESDLSDADRFSLAVTDAQKILGLLSDPLNDWVGAAYDRFRSSFATRIISGVGVESKDLLEICRSYPLFLGHYVGNRGPAVFSYQDLVEVSDDLLLFSGTDRNLAEKLSQALAEIETVLIPRSICLAIFDPGEGPSPCDPDSCIESIAKSKQLSIAPENRIPILDELLKFASGPTDNEDYSWQKSVRYLLHGEYERFDSDDMLFVEDPTTIDSVWSKLATAALGLDGENWQVVPSCLANFIAHQHYGSLKLGDINRDSVVQFIRDKGPENISCDLLTDTERDQVVREIDDYALLRNLCIHIDVRGVLQQIGPDTFLEDSFPSDDPLTKTIELIAKNTSSQELEFRQLQLVENRLWNAEAALQVAMNATDPSEHAFSVMKGLRLLESRIPLDLRQSLQDVKWLPAKDDVAIAPGDVVHISGLESQLAEVSNLCDGAVLSVNSLRSDFSDQDSLTILTKYVFLSQADTLNLIGMVLGEIESFRIGLGKERFDSANFHTWISVFEDWEQPLLPVVPILSSLLVGSGPQLIQSIRTSLVTELLRPISSTQYLSVLNRLAERHQSSKGADRDRIREVHSWYLEEATQAPEFRTTILPGLLLRNKSGTWKPSAKLCSSVENISDDDVLDDAQFRIIKEYLGYQQILPSPVNLVSTEDETRIRGAFIDYIKSWEGPCPPLVLGAFSAILGDDDDFRKLSGQLLSEGSRSVNFVRELFNWRPQRQRSTTGWIASENINEVMSSQKFSFTMEPGDSGEEVQIKSLLGLDFVAHLSQQISHLIVGERNSDRRIPHSPVNSPVAQERIAQVRIRMIDPLNFQEQAQEIIKTTAQVIWHEVFLQQGGLESAWEDLGSDDQLGVLAAQAMIQESLFFHMGQLRMPENKTIDELKNRWDELRRQRQEKIHLNQIGHSPVSRANIEADMAILLKELGTILESEPAVQEAFHQAVVKTVKDHQYGVNSIPFELFQNADDATAQLVEMQDKPIGNPFVIIEDNESLTFVHWGRTINRSRFGDFEQTKYRSDLENMLVMHASGKSSRGDEDEVTGKFGLGFKSVFLACKNPRVLSGSIGFEVLGGVYPKILPSDIREMLRSRVEDKHLDPLDATIIDFDVEHSDPTLRFDVLHRFRSLVSILHVFSRSIKTSEIYDSHGRHGSSWIPQYLQDVPNIEIGKISRPDQTVPVLFFNCSNNAGILFSLTGKGLGRLDRNIPSLWVTTPTDEPSNVGFSMNGMFGIDPGRGRLNVNSPETDKVTRELGYAAGETLRALAQRSESDWENLRDELGLEGGASPYDFWSSVWNLLGHGLSESNATDASDLQIAKQIFWDPDSGAMDQTIRRQCVIPSGLSGDYSELVSLAEIKYQVDGCLSHSVNFEGVSSWPAFKTKHRRGSLISRKFVGRPLRSLCPSLSQYDVVTLKSALDGEFPNGLALPESAEMVGETISTAIFDQLENGDRDERDERSEIISYLSSLKFRSKSGAWCDPSSLVISEPLPGVDADEPKRAAFAPDVHVLANDYRRSGLDFFLLCRRQLNANSDDMAEWALRVGDDESKRGSVLHYLLDGVLNDQLGSRLFGSIRGTWLGSLNPQSSLMEGYEEYERYRIFGLLRIGLVDNSPVGPDAPTIRLPERNPSDVLKEIYDWWNINRDFEKKIYDRSIYPSGEAPNLVTDLDQLKQDVVSREAWLETFILGSTFTMGRTKAEAHRNFVLQMRNDGWITKFATPKADATEFLKFLDGYFNHPNDRQDYYHWLRQFVSIYQLSRWLDDYAKIFLDLEHRSEFRLHIPLRNRRDSAYDFTGIDAPSLIPTLGYGACFIVRELARQNTLTSSQTHRYCYVPQARLRNFLGRLGCSGLDDGITTERSASIYEFLNDLLGDKASFGGDFDLPLQIIASGKDDLWERFMGSNRPSPSEMEEIDDDE